MLKGVSGAETSKVGELLHNHKYTAFVHLTYIYIYIFYVIGNTL